MGSIHHGPDNIPTVDISPFLTDASTAACEAVVQQMRHAVTEFGFFYLIGHGVAEEDRANVMACAKKFFALPLEEKLEVDLRNSLGKSHRGYEAPGIQTHQKGLLPDTKECFIIGQEIPADDPEAGTFSTGPNQWPKAFADEDFRLPIMDYQAQMVQLVKVLLKILAQTLPAAWGCPPDIFDELAEGRPSIPMRLLHYAAQPEEISNQFGVGDHTDFGCIAVLLQEAGTEGLEVWHPASATWIPVPVRAGSYVINIGDMLQKYTAGYFRSARHRVRNVNVARPRYSVPFFLNGNVKVRCKPLDGSAGAETVVGEYIMSRLIQTMGASGQKLSAK